MKLKDCKKGDTITFVVTGVVKFLQGDVIGVLSDFTHSGSHCTGNFFKDDTEVELIQPPLGQVGDVYTYPNNPGYRARIEFIFPNGDWAITYRYGKLGHTSTSSSNGVNQRGAIRASWG